MSDRKILHGKPALEICNNLQAKRAKELLGWEEEVKKEFGKRYLLEDTRKKKIRCCNNVTNRPIYLGNLASLTQEILRGRWKLNGENRIIGKTGLVLNGQHTLIALVLATQKWQEDPSKYPEWKTGPYIATSIMFGISEDDEVVNTIDTPKPRSLADVIYRSQYFSSLENKDRKKASRVLDYAVKLVWDRTGVRNAFAIRRTHSESLDFIARHPKIVDCATHVYEENGDCNKIGWYISPGSAAGLLYLMATSSTVSEKYHHNNNPREELLNWERWDDACDFWVLLAGKSPKTEAVRTVLTRLANDEYKNYASQCAILIKAWNLYLEGEEITTKALRLHYETRDDGFKELAECPVIGGIDVGDGEDIVAATKGDPTPEEIEKRTEKIRDGVRKKKKSTPKDKAGHKKTKKLSNLIGKVMWVNDAVNPWRGKVVAVEGQTAKLQCLTGFKGAGNIRETRLINLQKEQPRTQD